MRRTLTILGIAVFALLAIGFTLLASVSGVNALRHYGNIYHFITHQSVALVVATILGLVATFFDYHKWREHPWLVFALWVIIILMLCTLIPPFARHLHFKPTNGSYRWMVAGPIRVQPSELAKIVTILLLGVWIDRIGWRVELFWKGVVPMACFAGVFVVLVLTEPDLGAAVIIALLTGIMFFEGGVKWSHLGCFVLLALVAVLGVFIKTPNRMIRFTAFLSPEKQQKFVEFFNLPVTALAEKGEGADYQLNQSLVAFGNAYRSNLHPWWDPTHLHPWWNALTGVGYNESMQKRAYLPEAHTDFIFAIGAEEMGLLFSLVVLALFLTIFICGLRISWCAEDRLGKLLAYGATFLIAAQAVANLGVVTGCLPTKGLALPFMSYGGSNLISTLVCVGILMNVGLAPIREKRKFQRTATHEAVR